VRKTIFTFSFPLPNHTRVTIQCKSIVQPAGNRHPRRPSTQCALRLSGQQWQYAIRRIILQSTHNAQSTSLHQSVTTAHATPTDRLSYTPRASDRTDASCSAL